MKSRFFVWIWEKHVIQDTLTNLNQKQMVTAMGAGWNLGNQLEAANNGTPNETAWGNPTISANLIKAVKNAGFSSLSRQK